MDKLEFRLIAQILKTNIWAISFVVVLLSLLLFSIFLDMGERLDAQCTVIGKGVSFSHTGNRSEIRCVLENGDLIIRKNNGNRSYKVGQVITVKVKKERKELEDD